jgi:hypothetical protein
MLSKLGNGQIEVASYEHPRMIMNLKVVVGISRSRLDWKYVEDRVRLFACRRLGVTSLPTKVCVFSEVSRRRKTEVSYFTSQFVNNY